MNSLLYNSAIQSNTQCAEWLSGKLKGAIDGAFGQKKGVKILVSVLTVSIQDVDAIVIILLYLALKDSAQIFWQYIKQEQIFVFLTNLRGVYISV
jgi:hypothetical protein